MKYRVSPATSTRMDEIAIIIIVKKSKLNREFIFPRTIRIVKEKIAADKEPLEVANKATAHLYIANPLKNRHDKIGWFANLFNTHPPVQERIRSLRQMI